MWFGIVIGWIVLSLLVGTGAKNKGHSFAGYFFLSLFLSPLIGLILLVAAKPAETEKVADPANPTERGFFSKIAGVTKENPDGGSRQRLLRECHAGDKLELKREPSNRYDAHAIAVHLASGPQLGYLSAELAKELAPKMDKGRNFDVTISEITGGQGDKLSLGCNIKIMPEEESPPA